ncbi:MAG: DUF5658 family protein [Halobacteriales archaeon]|nr:DUF5658 family protein [Halobacteriales archaeon]
MARAEDLNEKIEEYWDWLTVALFLLTALDMNTTMYAAEIVGRGAEANPLMRWLLAQGLGVMVAAHLLAVVLVVAFFYAVTELLAETDQPLQRYFAGSVEVWLGLLVAAGLLVFTNNLVVIFFQTSLL